VTDTLRTRDDEPERPLPALPPGLEPIGADEPNGLWAGPADDPDRFELLGSGMVGGEGTTFKARYHGEGGTPLPVAVKRLSRPPGASATWPSRADWDRWRDQVQVIQQVRSPHLVQVRSVFPGAEMHPRGSLDPASGGKTYGVPYVVMEWVEGPSLDRLIRDGRVPLRRRGRLVAQLAEAVAALHSGTRTGGNPMLHRDIKPANCIVAPDAPPGEERLVLVDIGTLRRADAGHDPRGMHSLHYTAPEVLADPRSPRDPASDLYALGAVTFFCFTGKDPPVASSPGYLEHARAELDAALGDVRRRARGRVRDHVLRLLDPDPAARAVVRPLPWARTLEQLLGRRRRYRRLALLTSPLTVPVAALTLLWLTGVVTVEDTVEPPPGTAQDLARLVPFGDAYGRFPVRVSGDSVTVEPPRDFEHLYGVHLPGNACAGTVEFVAEVGTRGRLPQFGFAVAPRSRLDGEVPVGNSVQYEWQTPDVRAQWEEEPGAEPASFVRLAELPGGAWRFELEPDEAPDLRERHHVVVTAVGTSMTVSVDDDTLAMEDDIGAVECGGVTLRAWGAPVTFHDVRITSS
jgi:hypothetical protein